ncbi:MAG: hypothetical protein LAN71_01045 [Acidobacteriia bacterium]|nr:hypothetical protein [Terriglobia bacterium]
MAKNRASLLALAIVALLCAGSALTIVSIPAASQSSTDEAMKDYEETIKKGDAYFEAGNYSEAVLSYERARRVAYNNKLRTDSAALEKKLARARDAHAGKVPGTSTPAPITYFELTAKLADGPRVVTSRTVPQGDAHQFGPENPRARWNVTNPYLPVDRNFFASIPKMACAADGTLYLAADSIVPAAQMKREPRANHDYYADNGSGVWRVAPDGQVTVFGVRPYGNQVGWGDEKGKCNVRAADAGIRIADWRGMLVDPNGDIIFSDHNLHMILKLRKDGLVDQVAGGGPQACKYDRWKPPQQAGYQDGPAKQALFSGPQALAYDRDGSLLVADIGNCALRRLDAAGNVTTVHKGCLFDPNIHGDPANKIVYGFVAVDPEGLPVVGGTLNVPGVNAFSNLYRFHPDGKVERLLEGRLLPSKPTQQRLGWITDLRYIDGKLVISEGVEEFSVLHEVRGGRLSKYLGVGIEHQDDWADADGPASTTNVLGSAGFCRSADGTLFLLPYHNRHAVRKVDPKTKIVSTWVY